jgi:tetratricopeptide (TPR) repeat protein
MRSVAIPPASRKIAAGVLVSVLFAGVISAPSLCWSQTESPLALDRAKSMAEAQHEIVVLLIKQKEFQKAVAEANKIFEMKWPEDQESLLLRELLYLSDQFLRSSQAFLGLQVIEKGSKYFKKASSQVAILKEKGYLYKSMDQNDKAIDCFRRARELEDRK